VTIPPTPRPSALRQGARVLVLGVGLGVVCSVATTLVVFEVATRLAVSRWSPSAGAWVFQRLVLGQLGPLAIAPLATYLVGRAAQYPPWPVAAACVGTLQLCAVLQRGVFEGFAALASVEEVALLVVPALVGVVLARLALGRAGRRVEAAVAAPTSPGPATPAPEPPAAASAPPPPAEGK